MWTYFYRQYGDLAVPANLERCLEAMLRYKHVRLLEPDPDRIRAEFWQGEPTYARLFALFQRHHAERDGKPRWGVQTGLIERYADEVLAAHPRAKIIQMIRDPRDRYAGSLALWPNGMARAGGAVARWLYTAHLARRNLRRYPDRYLVVRFEDMVLDTEATIRRACAFLGESFYAEMLDMPGAIEHRQKLVRRSHGDPNRPPLSAQYIGIYRAEVPREEVRFIESLGRRALTRYGYSLEPRRADPWDTVKFLMYIWPLNMARMLAWLGIEAVHQNLPGYLGRNPGENMLIQPSGEGQWRDPDQKSVAG
jgi:hypothetical protein